MQQETVVNKDESVLRIRMCTLQTFGIWTHEKSYWEEKNTPEGKNNTKSHSVLVKEDWRMRRPCKQARKAEG